MIPKSSDILRTANAARIEGHEVIMLKTEAARSVGELLAILEQINWSPLSNVQPSSLEEIDGYYTIEVLIPAKHAIGGIAFWERVENKGQFYRADTLNDDLLRDLQIARQHHGRSSTRLVRCTKSVVASSAPDM